MMVLNWASEGSPMHTGVFNRDFARYSVLRGPRSVGGITWAKRNHAQSQYWAVKSDQ